jgi:hypothetical protein
MKDEDLERLFKDPEFLYSLPRAARLKSRRKPVEVPQPEKPPELPVEPERPKHRPQSLIGKGISYKTGKPKDMRQARHPNVLKNGRTPEVLEKMRLGGLKSAMVRSMNRITRSGQPDGVTKKQSDEAWAKAREEAERILNTMVEQGMTTEEELGNEALKFAIAVVRNDTQPLREKLSAAKLVLEYTKAKPMSKQEVTVNKAEDFLAALITKKE